jgi:hypothetical protein
MTLNHQANPKRRVIFTNLGAVNSLMSKLKAKSKKEDA